MVFFIPAVIIAVTNFGPQILGFSNNPQKTFRRYENDFNAAVMLARSGQLETTVENQHIKILPLRYRYLSDGGGEVIVEKPTGNMRMFFFTFRGMMSGYHGYLYTADGQPTMYELGNVEREVKIDSNWYWMVVSD